MTWAEAFNNVGQTACVAAVILGFFYMLIKWG